MNAEVVEDANNFLINSLEKLVYFHGKVSLAQVNSLLKVDGDFLIQMVDQASNFKTKESIGGGSLPVLSVKQSGKVRHWLIKQNKGKFGIEQAIFPSISSMISFYLAFRKSIVEGENVLIKNAVLPKPEGIEECDEKACSELPSFVKENDVSSADVIADDEVDADSMEIPSDLGTSQGAALDGNSSGLAVDNSSSLDITASVFRGLGIGISDGDLGSSSTVLLNGNPEKCSESVDNVSAEQKNSSESIRKCKSAPVQISYPQSVKLSSDSLLSSSSQIQNLYEERLSDPSACSTWPSLQLFNSGSVCDTTSGSQLTTSTPVQVSSEFFVTPVTTNLRNVRSVSFALPKVESSYGTLRSLSAVEYHCTACSSSLSLDYDSLDKLELRYKIAKASSFYDFVRLYGASNGGSALSMPTMVRLAELLFKDYKQHVVDSLQLGTNSSSQQH